MLRWLVVRWFDFMAENDIENPDDIKKFDRLGYIFRSDLSSDSNMFLNANSIIILSYQENMI